MPAYLRRYSSPTTRQASTCSNVGMRKASKSSANFEAAGIARPGANPAVRAAVMLANDLALVLLRPFLEAVTGLDPLSPEGAAAFVKETVLIYTEGAFQIPEHDEKEQA